MLKLPQTRRQQLENRMREAKTYPAWTKAARAYDRLTGMAEWREIDKTRLYDHVSIRQRLERLRDLRKRGDHTGLLFTLNEGIHGNMGGMGKAELHERARFGTKRLVEEYVAEIATALKLIAGLDEQKVSFEQKLDFFNRASHCYGRSALMLSGGGALGFYHVGVVKALVEQHLLPSVISGASAGSLVAAILGTHTDAELDRFFDAQHIRFEAEQEASWFNRMFWSNNARIDVHDLEEVVSRLVPDLTFEEAFRKTGRHISIFHCARRGPSDFPTAQCHYLAQCPGPLGGDGLLRGARRISPGDPAGQKRARRHQTLPGGAPLGRRLDFRRPARQATGQAVRRQSLHR
jgi:TAG lipase / steryl ester hydrolase / phospholipase A2 / LPA acyltransferase